METCWVATLANGETIVGRPSWGSGGNGLRAPATGQTDWGRLMARCRDEHLRLTSLSLYLPKFGLFPAPTNKPAYGYFEEWEADTRGGRACTALAICWAEREKGRSLVKVQMIRPQGILERWNRRSWQPCMIGDPEWQPGKGEVN